MHIHRALKRDRDNEIAFLSWVIIETAFERDKSKGVSLFRTASHSDGKKFSFSAERNLCSL